MYVFININVTTSDRIDCPAQRLDGEVHSTDDEGVGGVKDNSGPPELALDSLKHPQKPEQQESLQAVYAQLKT